MKKWRQTVADYKELMKPGIVGLALCMSLLGFITAAPFEIRWGALLASLFGIGLVGAASGVLNQYVERDIDAKMWRTLARPLPSGRIAPQRALVLGWTLAAIGEFVLLIGVNPVTAVLAALTLLFYLGIYTPAKRVSSLSTLIGAIPGAMPPLMGWTAARGTLNTEALILFAIVFLWQVPHFLAIGWLYKEDYARASLPILTVVDEDGSATAREILIYSFVLLPATLVPSAWGLAGDTYFRGAVVLGVGFLLFSGALAVFRTRVDARRLFLASIIYLPALGGLMIWDRC